MKMSTIQLRTMKYNAPAIERVRAVHIFYANFEKIAGGGNI